MNCLSVSEMKPLLSGRPELTKQCACPRPQHSVHLPSAYPVHFSVCSSQLRAQARSEDKDGGARAPVHLPRTGPRSLRYGGGACLPPTLLGLPGDKTTVLSSCPGRAPPPQSSLLPTLPVPDKCAPRGAVLAPGSFPHPRLTGSPGSQSSVVRDASPTPAPHLLQDTSSANRSCT